jgi:uncharacterized protein YjbI with pentapeptide repeats
MDNYYTKYIKYKSKYLELKGIKGNGSFNNVIKGGGNDGAYYSKYMKYKTKYIKERGLVGGVLGTKPCPPNINFLDNDTTTTVLEYLKNYNCTYLDFVNKFKDKSFKINYEIFNKKSKQNNVTIIDLKNAGFPSSELKNAGFPLQELINADYEPWQLRDAQYDARELKNAGFSAIDLKNAWFNASELKNAGFSASDLRRAGFNLKQLKNAGFTLQQLINTGFSVSELSDELFSASDLKNAGFSASDLRGVGFNLKQLKNAGFTLQQLINTGFSVSELSDELFSASDLKNAGFSASDLRGVGFNLKQLKNAGFSASDLRGVGINLKLLKNAGFSVSELRDAVFSIQELRDAGFSASELIDAEYNATELKKIDVDVQNMKDNGYSAIEILFAGYTPEQLTIVGYTQVDINKATYLKDNRFTVKQLTDYTQEPLTDYTREPFKSLKDYTRDQLIDAKYISILKNDKTVYPSAYIDNTLLLLRPRVLVNLFQKKDKRILFFKDYDHAYLYFYSKLKEYVYQKYGNTQNMHDLKKNWKISLYRCHVNYTTQRFSFDETQFNKNQKDISNFKPLGIWGSEMFPYENTWIEYVLEDERGKFTGRPCNCSGFLIFRLNDDKILHILNKEDLEKLKPYLGLQNEYLNVYDWLHIAKEYNAINAPYMIKNWDGASTVVWNKEAVADFHFITLRDLPFVKNFVNCEMLFLPNIADK